MLNYDTFKNLIAKLEAAFGKELIDKQKMLYYERLKYCEYDRLIKAINKAIDSCKYFPSIAILKAKYNEIEPETEEYKEKSWLDCTDAVDLHFFYKNAPLDSKPYIPESLRYICEGKWWWDYVYLPKCPEGRLSDQEINIRKIERINDDNILIEEKKKAGR